MSDKEDNSFKFRWTNTNNCFPTYPRAAEKNIKSKPFLATDKGG
jgi:hypothetical protein